MTAAPEQFTPEFFNRFFDDAPCGFVISDVDGRLVRINRTISEWLALQALPGDGTVAGLLDIPSRYYFETHVYPLLLMQSRASEIALNLQTSTGVSLPTILNARMLPAEEGVPARLLFAFLNAVDRRQYERELVLANRRTEAALAAAAASAEAMESFAYFASHDLEAPLRKIRLHVDLLARAIANADDADRDHCIDVIVRSARQGSDLISALLRYSRARNVALVTQSCDLRELLRQAANDCLESTPLPLGEIDITVPPIAVVCDPALIRQVFQNLIGNALKYTKTGVPAHLTITLEDRPADRIRKVIFQDQGIGFEPEQATRIFAPMHRLVEAKAYPGTGIGLALVQAVIERHGWMISATGEPGVGAVFTISIPI